MLDTSNNSIKLTSIGCLSLNSPISELSKIAGLTIFNIARVEPIKTFSSSVITILFFAKIISKRCVSLFVSEFWIWFIVFSSSFKRFWNLIFNSVCPSSVLTNCSWLNFICSQSLKSGVPVVMTRLLRVIRVMIYRYIYLVCLFRSMVFAHPRCLAVRSGVIHSLTQTLGDR